MGLFNFLFKKKNQELVENKAVETVVEAVEEPQEEIEVKETVDDIAVEEKKNVNVKHPERKPMKEHKEWVCNIKLDKTYSYLRNNTVTDLKFEVGDGCLLIKSIKPIRHSKVTDCPEMGCKKVIVNNNITVLLHDNGLIEIK